MLPVVIQPCGTTGRTFSDIVEVEMMESNQQGQVTQSAAEIYEQFFVPALFGEWAPRVAGAANIKSGDRVLDVACGTGVLAREVSRRAGAPGNVIGLDRNEWMFDVARRVAPDIEWVVGVAEELPFEDQTFDAVVSQFGLMFFDQQWVALTEMWRVLRSGGRLAVAVWDSAENTPGYAAMIALLGELFGPDEANALQAPYSLGDTTELQNLFEQAGISDAGVDTVLGTARFPSIESWVFTDVKGWTLADMIDDDQYAILELEAEERFARFRQSDGSVSFASPAHIISATK
jgi:ubiquinone/menaquinone biosynthesis C-methylase UbiE